MSSTPEDIKAALLKMIDHNNIAEYRPWNNGREAINDAKYKNLNFTAPTAEPENTATMHTRKVDPRSPEQKMAAVREIFEGKPAPKTFTQRLGNVIIHPLDSLRSPIETAKTVWNGNSGGRE